MRRLPATVRHSVLLLAVACYVGEADAQIIDAGDCKCCHSLSELLHLILGGRVDSSCDRVDSSCQVIESLPSNLPQLLKHRSRMYTAGVVEQITMQCCQSRAEAVPGVLRVLRVLKVP
jgi:hypothetical protein